MKKFLCIFFVSWLIGAFTLAPAYAGYFCIDFPPPDDPNECNNWSWFPYNGTHWEPGINTAKSNIDEFGNYTVPVAGEATWSLGPGWAALTNLPDVDGVPYEIWAMNTALNWWADVSGFTNLGLTNGSTAPFGAPSTEGGAMGDIRFGWGHEDYDYAPGLSALLDIPPCNPPGTIGLALAIRPDTEANCPDCKALCGCPATEVVCEVYGTLGGDIRFGGYDPTDRRWVDEPGDVIGDGQYDFFTDALHETGHALGLDHPYPNNIPRPPGYAARPSLMEMYNRRGGAMRALSKEDIQHIQALYGPGDFTPAEDLPDDFLYTGPDEDPGMIYHESYTGPIWGEDLPEEEITYYDLQEKMITSFWTYEQLTLTIVNSTGETWTDFHFDVRSDNGNASFVGPAPYDGPGTATLSADGKGLDVVGLNIPDGESYTLTVEVQPGLEMASLFGYPTVDEEPVSEAGDIDGDGDIDFDDFYDFLDAFGKCTGDAGFNPLCDYDNDGCITFVDYQIWYGFYLNG